ncbi:MAG: SCP2 domain-containing protein [Halothiobacillaceae bacterium]
MPRLPHPRDERGRMAPGVQGTACRKPGENLGETVQTRVLSLHFAACHSTRTDTPMPRLPTLLLPPLERALNEVLDMDPDTRERLARHEGSVLALRLQVPPLSLHLMPTARGVHLLSDFDGQVDATISASSFGLLRAAGRREDLERAFDGAVHLDGDIRLAGSVARALAHLDPDWAEWLSERIGDPAAHAVEQAVEHTRNQVERARASTRIEWSDFLRHEAALVVGTDELAGFSDAVDRLRDDLARLEARLERLAGRVAGPDTWTDA